MKNYWIIGSGQNTHSILLQGLAFNGEFIIVTDGVQKTIMPIQEGEYLTVRFHLEGYNCVLSKPEGSDHAILSANTVRIDYSELPELLPDISVVTDEMPADTKTSDAKIRSKRASFLSFSIFSLVNIVLISFGASIYFPFSSFVASSFATVGKYMYLESGNTIFLVGGIGIGVIISLVFLLLYHISKKSDTAIIVALVLVGIDTAVLILGMSDDLTGSLLDIGFHIWVVYDLITLLILSKGKKKAKTKFDVIN